MKALLISILCGIFPILAWAQVSKSSFFLDSYRSDSVVICGQILNRTVQTVPSVSLNHFITDESIKISIPVDSLGNFSVKVPVFNTTWLYVYYVANGSVISLFAEPGEKIIIHSDWKNNRVTFEGKYAKEHQEVFDYNSYMDRTHPAYTEFSSGENIPHELYLQKLKQFTYHRDSILNDYIKQHPAITKRSIQEIRIRNYNNSAFFLMQRRFALDRMSGEKFSKTYMKYADSIFAALPRPYTAVSTTFLRNYLDYYSETKQTPVAFRQAIIDYAIEKKRITLNEEQQKDPSLILKVEEFQPILADIFYELKDTERFKRIMLDYYNGGALIVPMPVELKELVTTQSFYKYLNDNRTAFSDAHVDYFKQQVKNPELRKFVLDCQYKLSGLESSKLDFTECLKDAALFKDCKTGEELFTRLIAPHKGKIIYLDVWGTWCPPCKEEMKFAGAIKETMKGKDIVFLYMANRSSEVSWKNVIKENHLTGKQVEHYNLPSAQQSMVEDYLGAHSYPSYFIIDREGKVIERESLRPSKGKQLIDHLNELLSK